MELVARRYSQRTIKQYLYHNREFLEFFKKDPYEVSNEAIRGYLYHLANDKEVSTSTLNIAINALTFYYGEILKQRFVYDIKRPRKDKKLPVVLSQEEVSQILSSVNNIKHKAIFPGQRKDKHLTIRTVQKTFENACKKTGVTKEVTVHSLRHSFATHLLER